MVDPGAPRAVTRLRRSLRRPVSSCGATDPEDEDRRARHRSPACFQRERLLEVAGRGTAGRLREGGRVEGRRVAGRGSVAFPAAFAPDRRPTPKGCVASPRSPNPACRFPAPFRGTYGPLRHPAARPDPRGLSVGVCPASGQGFPCCVHSPLPHVPPPLCSCRSPSRPLAALPVFQAGRLPHHFVSRPAQRFMCSFPLCAVGTHAPYGIWTGWGFYSAKRVAFTAIAGTP